MNSIKFARFVVLAGLAGFYGISNAAVYDFGNLDTVSGGSLNNTGTRIGTYNIGSGKAATNLTDESYRDDAKVKGAFDFAENNGTAPAAIDSARDVRHDRHYNLDLIKRKVKEGRLYPESRKDEDSSGSSGDGEGTPHKDDNGYTPIASAVPEPETYAMILAGLGLIAMTLRHRKEAP